MIFLKKKKPKDVSRTISVLDIGSHKVACLIATEDDERNMLEIKGAGYGPSRGVREGFIADMAQAGTAIAEALAQAERAADQIVELDYINISGNQTHSTIMNVELSVDGQMIRQDDIDKIISEITKQYSANGQFLIHCLPVHYNLDGNHSILNPVGMSGYKLEIDFHVLTINQTIIKNILTCLNQYRIEAKSFIVSPYAAALATLTEDEKQIGSTLIDFGAQTTSYALFLNGHFVASGSIPVGGHHITKDIAKGLSVSLGTAEKLKVDYASLAHFQAQYDLVDLSKLGEKTSEHSRQISKTMLNKIAKARVEEILEQIKAKLIKSDVFSYTKNNVIITGGSIGFEGFLETAHHFFGQYTRLAYPQPIEGLPDFAKTPEFTTSLGMLSYNMLSQTRPHNIILPQIAQNTVWSKFNHWINENF